MCEACWINTNASATTMGAAIRRPHMLKDPVIEQCAWCGHFTIVGIYTRVDPATVPYPTKED